MYPDHYCLRSLINLKLCRIKSWCSKVTFHLQLMEKMRSEKCPFKLKTSREISSLYSLGKVGQNSVKEMKEQDSVKDLFDEITRHFHQDLFYVNAAKNIDLLFFLINNFFANNLMQNLIAVVDNRSMDPMPLFCFVSKTCFCSFDC